MTMRTMWGGWVVEQVTAARNAVQRSGGAADMVESKARGGGGAGSA